MVTTASAERRMGKRGNPRVSQRSDFQTPIAFPDFREYSTVTTVPINEVTATLRFRSVVAGLGFPETERIAASGVNAVQSVILCSASRDLPNPRKCRLESRVPAAAPSTDTEELPGLSYDHCEFFAAHSVISGFDQRIGNWASTTSAEF